jgi:ribonucleoside-diphosphate reductase alpha chain
MPCRTCSTWVREDALLLNAMFSRKEPKSGADGTLSWTVDILNPATGDDYAMFVKA